MERPVIQHYACGSPTATLTVRINSASLPLSASLQTCVRRMGLRKDSRNQPNAYKKSFLFFPPLLKNNNNRKENSDFMDHFSPLLWLASLCNTEKNPRCFHYGASKERERESNGVPSFFHPRMGAVFSSLACGHAVHKYPNLLSGRAHLNCKNACLLEWPKSQFLSFFTLRPKA